MFKGLRYDSTMKSKFDGMLEEFMAFEGIEYQNIADSMEDISEVGLKGLIEYTGYGRT